ncbi:P-loop containing nucleoside triphosphate hydrolase protein [Pelagophyceae sp. CCMP2097]|nr:P-loop containing nucleoside triphosphate hydrolase protein [Pelagophyceae sp. CCMP2097]
MAGDKQLILVALACILVSGAAQLALPNYQGRIIDAIYHKDRGAFRKRLLLYLGYSGAAAVASALRALCFQLAGRRFACRLRNRLWKAIVNQDVSFFDRTASGTLTSQLTQDVNQMTTPLTTLLGTLCASTIQLVGGVAMAFFTSWRLSMLAFTTIGPIIHITMVYAEWSRHLNIQILGHLAVANATATEALINIRTVKALATEDFERAQFEEETARAQGLGALDAARGGALSAATQLVNNAQDGILDYGAGWLILSYGGVLAMRDGAERSGLSAGRLVTYQLYFNKIQSSYNALVSLLASFMRATGAAERVLGLMALTPALEDGTEGFDHRPEGRIEFCDVDFSYETRLTTHVLQGLSLTVPAGSTLALVGRSGSGKTTALNLMLRFYDPISGSVLLDGRDLKSLDNKAMRRFFGVVQQETQLFNKSIGANVAYGVLEHDEDYAADPAFKRRVERASVAALADEFIRHFPEGYDSQIGERGLRLSGGQKQRVSIARAFLRAKAASGPRVLLLDEATSALDGESEAAVQLAVDNLIAQSKCTVVLVAHRLSTVRNADNIAVMSAGRIVELGSHRDLVERGGIYATLVKRQLAAAANALTEGDVDTVSRGVREGPPSRPRPQEAATATALCQLCRTSFG